MIYAFTCLASTHDLSLVVAAGVAALLGSLVTAHLFCRTGPQIGGSASWRLLQAGLTGGATIWTAHFVAMIGYRPGVDHAYSPELTVLSLFVAMGGVCGGILLNRGFRNAIPPEIGGAVAGLGIVATHFTGMASLEVAGTLIWDRNELLLAALAGPALTALAANRMGRPVGRWCWVAGTCLFAGAICATHFAAMSAVTVIPASAAQPLRGLIPSSFLAFLVIGVMAFFVLGGLVGFLLDETTRRETAEDMRRQALHDDLTGLPNRADLRRSLGIALDAPDAAQEGIAVASLDLDRFKQINDVHGHVGGDALLEALANRLRDRLLPGETLHRIGADEFVATKRAPGGPEGALAFAARMRDALLPPVEWHGCSLAVGASAGVALAPLHGMEADVLLGRADLAMHRAKVSRLTEPQLYDPGMDEASRTRSALAIELRQALAQKEFELFLQPQVRLDTREVRSYEALIRWRHPLRGLVPPDAFIPLAEATGLVVPIGHWVLHEACTAAASWPAPHRIAVNVAPQQLTRPGFAASVIDALRTSGLSSDRLELELTEASLIDDKAAAHRVIRHLKRAGVRVAMDDYGAGYASLATLQAFPFNKIKIDRAFIGPVATDRQAAAIVRSTLILGEALEIPVLAEGVETEEQARFLLAHGCREAQGWLFGRPRPRAEVEAEMRAAAQAA